MDHVRSYLDATEEMVVGLTPRAVSVADQIAAWIRDRIQFGQFRPGEALREAPLAERFGVSRGPVREALKMLDREGVVAVRGRSGAMVRVLDRDELMSIFRIRAELSGLNMRLAATRPGRDPRHLEAVRDGAAALVALAVDREAPVSDYILVRRRLTAIISILADAPYLGRIGLELELELALHWASMMAKGRQHASSRAWLRIADAIIDGDGDLAEREGRDIVLASLDELLARYDEDGLMPEGA